MKKMLLVLALSAISGSAFALPHMGTAAPSKAGAVINIPFVHLNLPGIGGARPPESKTIVLPGLGFLTISDHDGGTGQAFTITVDGQIKAP